MVDNYLPSQTKQHRPETRLLLMLTGSVFLIELLVTLFLEILPPMHKTAILLLDATLLTTLIFPVFYFLVYRPLTKNIADLRRAEENLRTVSVAFESKDPILIADADANILRANRMFLKITGYDTEEIIGKNPHILKTGWNSKEYYKKMWDHLLRHGSWAGDTRIKHKRGHEFTMGVVITAVKNDRHETTHYVAIYNL